jgi:molybdopterin converting factor small subunit
VIVEVRYFASLVDRAGCGSEQLTVEPGEDVARLWQRLVERHPALSSLGYRPLVACDCEYAAWERRLAGVREVAFLPPFSGG